MGGNGTSQNITCSWFASSRCYLSSSVQRELQDQKQIPMQFASEQHDVKKRKIGRPQDEQKNDAFLKVAWFLQENDDEQITVVDLVEKMEEYLGDSASTAYGRTHMKARLQEHFGDQIFVTEINGKPNVVTFRRTVANILYDFHAQPKNVDLETEKLNINPNGFEADQEWHKID